METLFVSLILSSNSSTKLILLIVLAICEILFSFITLYLYRKNKQNAKMKKKELPDWLLLLFPWLMGGLGGFFSIYSLRCKTHLWYFPFNNVLALIVQASIFISIAVLV